MKDKILVVVENRVEDLECEECTETICKVLLEDENADLPTVYCESCYDKIKEELDEAKKKLEEISELLV